MSSDHTKRYALLVSGSGTTAEKIIESCLKPDGALYNLYEPACLIASRDGIGAIDKALSAGIDKQHIYVVNPGQFACNEDFGKQLIKIFKKEEVNLFGQHGWMPMTPSNVLEEYLGINQHPGALPHFGGHSMYGHRVHAAVLHFRKLSGEDIWTEAIAQLVDPEFDKGIVIARQPIPVLATDTVETLQKRVLSIEHSLQIFALLKLYSHRNILIEEPPSPVMPIILSRHKRYLEKAKELAIADYPNG